MNTIFNAKVKLPFNITYQFNIAPRFQFFYDRYFTSAERPNSNPNDRGTNREQAKRFNWSLNNTITWDQTFANRHHVILTFVQEAEERQYWSDRIEARNILPSDALGFHNTQNGDKSVSSFRTDDNHQTADALMHVHSILTMIVIWLLVPLDVTAIRLLGQIILMHGSLREV